MIFPFGMAYVQGRTRFRRVFFKSDRVFQWFRVVLVLWSAGNNMYIYVCLQPPPRNIVSPPLTPKTWAFETLGLVMLLTHTWIFQGSEIWAPKKKHPKTDPKGLKFDAQTDGLGTHSPPKNVSLQPKVKQNQWWFIWRIIPPHWWQTFFMGISGTPLRQLFVASLPWNKSPIRPN